MLFPTIYSTLHPAALATHLSKGYGLLKCSCRLVLRGVGDTYLVDAASGKSILRIYRNTHRTLEHVQAEVELLLQLRQANVAVAYPLADLSGNIVQSFEAAEGTRYAVLFSYAPGESVTKLSDHQLRSLGREIARFHLVSSAIILRNQRWSFTMHHIFTESLERATPHLTSIPEELTWWLHAAEKAQKELINLPTQLFGTGYCHYDFLPKNFHFEDDRITLFDFDFFGHGWLVNDLMTFWTQLCLDEQFNRITKAEAVRSFALVVEAYRSIRPISQEELQAIPSLSVGWWCYYMGFHATHDQFMAFIEPSHLKMRTDLIRRLTEKNYDNFRF